MNAWRECEEGKKKEIEVGLQGELEGKTDERRQRLGTDRSRLPRRGTKTPKKGWGRSMAKGEIRQRGGQPRSDQVDGLHKKGSWVAPLSKTEKGGERPYEMG